MKRPASQYYWGDWRRDTALQGCSIAARGLWHEMNCLMHDCEPYGHLCVGGKAMQPAQLARLVGVTPKECQRLLDELQEADVFSRTEDGVIYSRRMVRDEALRERRANGGAAGAEHGAKGAQHGAKGGRPATSKGVGKGGFETPLSAHTEPPPASASASAKELLPDEPDGSSSSPGATADRSEHVPACPYEAIVAAYHQALPMLPRVRLMDDKRKTLMRKRWAWVFRSTRPDGSRRASNADEAVAWLRDYFARAALNAWLTGQQPSRTHPDWKADLDFLLKDAGLKAVIERTEVPA